MKDGSTSLVDFQYTHDANSRILTITDNVDALQNRTYGYDSVGRLVTADGPWGIGTFEYDSLGNLREKDLGGRRVQIDYDWLNRLKRERDTGGTGLWRDYTHDARGNVIDNDRIAFTYDAANQPVSITGAATGAFQYDGNGKRVKQTINGETIYSAYGQSGALLYRENATTTDKTDYVRVSGITVARIKAGVTSYLHADHLGSPVAATTTGGAVQWREHWTPYGEKLVDPSGNQNDEGFTGHIADTDTGLTYMQARYYDPIIGRFLSGDPIGFSVDQPQMFNRYSYTFNDPVNMVDPDGELGQLALSGVCGPGFIVCALGIVAVSVTVTCLAADCSQVLKMAKRNKQQKAAGKNPKQKAKTTRGNNRKTGDDPNPDQTTQEKAEGKRGNSTTKDKKTPPKQKQDDSGKSGTNKSASSDSRGQATTNVSTQGGSRFHGNRTSVVDGRATRLEQRDLDEKE